MKPKGLLEANLTVVSCDKIDVEIVVGQDAALNQEDMVFANDLGFQFENEIQNQQRHPRFWLEIFLAEQAAKRLVATRWPEVVLDCKAFYIDKITGEKIPC